MDTIEEPDFLTQVDKGYIGIPPINKPLATRTWETDRDPHYWKRRKAAEKSGRREEDLEDEPDNDPASPEQAWI